ncbi:hypothetical protein D3C72_2500090 [compost metagenome]
MTGRPLSNRKFSRSERLSDRIEPSPWAAITRSAVRALSMIAPPLKPAEEMKLRHS